MVGKHPDRVPVEVLGRVIGTSDYGWDQTGDFEWMVMNFEPSDKVEIPPLRELVVDYEDGLLKGNYNDEGNHEWEMDMIACLHHLERSNVVR